MAARPGKPLEAKLDSDWGRTHYKIKLLQADRVVMKVKVDPATGAVIDSKKIEIPAFGLPFCYEEESA